MHCNLYLLPHVLIRIELWTLAWPPQDLYFGFFELFLHCFGTMLRIVILLKDKVAPHCQLHGEIVTWNFGRLPQSKTSHTIIKRLVLLNRGESGLHAPIFKFSVAQRSRVMSSQRLAYSIAFSDKTIDAIGPKFGMVGQLGKDYMPTKFQLSSSIPSMSLTTMVPIFWEFPFLKKSYLWIPWRYQKNTPFRHGAMCREPSKKFSGLSSF